MKTVTRNVSMPEELAKLAQQQVRALDYASFSAYVVELFRQERQRIYGQDLAVLNSVPDSPEPPPDSWKKFHSHVRRRRKARA